ncbi:hemerythrin domain-containing protein [Blastococcus sp. TF02A-26]|uniref:hemerythrin domain-containing protein n=1 Tax=Blastococcus sp. TF02A-26 TaxID=2250577 RepID=UPI000DEBF3D7|nr:hemerythrin domain-containing protein [Blastococcus sp. TF02A-26]RBY85109.1 hemerythrin domain-containing protein [Blastococcus sp. TF02A-26]
MPTLAVRPAPSPTPVPSAPAAPCRATAHQLVVHRLARREFRVLARLATWAAADDAARTAALAAHADLVGRVLLHHHALERELIWPALLRELPDRDADRARDRIADWTARCARVDHLLRDISTAARQWSVTGTGAARDAFAMACLVLAGAVDEQTGEEERELLPLLAALPAQRWSEITASAGCALSGREQLFVLGRALEDAPPGERSRMLAALPPATRTAWRLSGRRRYRAAVIRLRGEPPAP